MKEPVTVRCMPAGVDVEVPPGTSIMAAVRRVPLPLASSCDGFTVCGWCVVRILSGERNVNPPGEEERALLRSRGAPPGARLACRAHVRGPVTVTTSYW